MRRGGRRSVGGRMLVRKDWVCVRVVLGLRWTGGAEEGGAYGEFAGTPESFDDADVVDCHYGKKEFCGVCVACL